MTLPILPTLPIRSEVTDEQFVAQVEALFRALPAWSAALGDLGGAIALGTTGNSTTPMTNDVSGNKTITIQPGRGFMKSQRIVNGYSSTVYQIGRVVSYDVLTGELVYTPEKAFGVGGSYSAWSVSLTPEVDNIGKQALWIPARAWVGRPTNPAAPGTLETTTNKVVLKSLDFDASTIEYAQFDLGTGKSWNGGTLTAIPIWSHAATTTNFKVSFGLQALCLGDGDALDTAFGTAQYSNDTGGATDREYAGPETAAITVSNSPAEGKRLILQCLRKADDATNDTLAIDARLHGWIVYLTTDQGNDA